MNWYILAIISLISLCLADLFLRVAMKEEDSDPMASTVFFQFLLTAVVAVFAFWHGFVMPPIAAYPFNFLLSAIFWGLGSLFVFKAAKLIEISDIVILSTFGPVITVVLSVLFLGDSFSLLQVLGSILIILPIILLQQKLSFKDKKGVVFAMLATLFGAVAVVNDVFIIRNYEPISYVVVMSFLPGLVLLIIEPKVIFRIKGLFTAKYMRSNLLYGFLYAIQAVTYYMAIIAGASSSQMSVMFKASLIITIILAAIFLKERDRLPAKFVAAGVVSIGIILVSGII